MFDGFVEFFYVVLLVLHLFTIFDLSLFVYFEYFMSVSHGILEEVVGLVGGILTVPTIVLDEG